jgi:hypothetical protein
LRVPPGDSGKLVGATLSLLAFARGRQRKRELCMGLVANVGYPNGEVD